MRLALKQHGQPIELLLPWWCRRHHSEYPRRSHQKETWWNERAWDLDARPTWSKRKLGAAG